MIVAMDLLDWIALGLIAWIVLAVIGALVIGGGIRLADDRAPGRHRLDPAAVVERHHTIASYRTGAQPLDDADLTVDEREQ